MRRIMKKTPAALLGVWGLLLMSPTAQAQEQPYSLEALLELVELNNPNVQVSKAALTVADQQIRVAKTKQLPNLQISANAFYLSDAHVLDKGFSKVSTIAMPHFGNSYALEATQLIYGGGAVATGIAMADLQKSLSALQLDNNLQEAKFLVAGYYLDLAKLYNQKQVYLKNIELAEKQQQNITKFYNQGMVTKNDVIRGQLLISNFKLALEQVENGILMYNKQLTIAVGLEDEVQIKPNVGSLLERSEKHSEAEVLSEALEQNPQIKMADTAVQLSEAAIELSKAAKRPKLAAFAGNNLQRPITNTSPALDYYNNVWQTGFSLSFDLASLYKAPKEIQASKDKKQLALTQKKAAEKQLETGVKLAVLNLDLAQSQKNTFKTNSALRTRYASGRTAVGLPLLLSTKLDNV